MAVHLKQTRTCLLVGCECRTRQAPTTGTFPQVPHSGNHLGPWRRDQPVHRLCSHLLMSHRCTHVIIYMSTKIFSFLLKYFAVININNKYYCNPCDANVFVHVFKHEHIEIRLHGAVFHNQTHSVLKNSGR